MIFVSHILSISYFIYKNIYCFIYKIYILNLTRSNIDSEYLELPETKSGPRDREPNGFTTADILLIFEEKRKIQVERTNERREKKRGRQKGNVNGQRSLPRSSIRFPWSTWTVMIRCSLPSWKRGECVTITGIRTLADQQLPRKKVSIDYLSDPESNERLSWNF